MAGPANVATTHSSHGAQGPGPFQGSMRMFIFHLFYSQKKNECNNNKLSPRLYLSLYQGSYKI